MAIQNSKRAIFLPLILAGVLMLGILAGNFLNRNHSSKYSLNPVIGKLNSMLDFIESEYVDSISKEEIVEKSIPQILKELDPHSQYIPAKELQSMTEPLEGNFEGIGIQFNIQDDTVIVVNTVQGGPSEKRGILSGDRIVKVNDTLIAGVKITNSKVMKKLRGKKGTRVNLKISRRNIKELLTFDIIREQIPILSVDASFMITNNIGYIKISKFSKTTHFEFRRATTQLKKLGMEKIILDIRGNGGGYLDAAVNLADEFLADKKLIVYTKGYSRPKTCYYATPRGFCHELEAAVLIDELSASASEILAGAIQDNDRGIVIGRRSFGKGLVQEPIQFSDGSELRLTIARYYTPTGRCIQKSYKKGTDEYYNDLDERLLRGELEKADSIKFADSLKFKTPDGRIVYGGGGIMPDIFVPLDTVGYTSYLNRVINKGIIYKFAFHYADGNRKKLSSIKDANELEKYLAKQNLLNEFTDFAEKNGVPKNPVAINKSALILTTQLKAYISRNIIDDKGFYPIILKIDNTVTKAVEVLKNN
ncbi:MAG: S41 family peptidase [Bacteroidia bacterium]|nr:S41 family peptidase [Bacteroidia bacterium]